MKKNILIFFLLLVLFIFVNPMLAWDDTHEKPQDFRKPDKHRIFLRGQIAGGGLKIPEIDQEKGSAQYSLASSNGTIISLPGIGSNYNGAFATGNLEYRYEDKIRLLYDSRKASPLGIPDFSSVNYSFASGRLATFGSLNSKLKGWEESTTKMGLAYYHSFGNHLSVGVIGRKYDITQSYGRTDSGTSLGSSTFFFQNSRSNYETNISGFVPGIGIEIKPTRWFEIIYTHEVVNLTGKQRGTGAALLFGSISNSSSSATSSSTAFSLLLFNLTNTNLTYKGTVQNLDFVFRYTSWFATRYGFTQERYTRKFENYLSISPFASASSVLTNAILYPAFTQSEVVFRNFHLTIEFSKGFN